MRLIYFSPVYWDSYAQRPHFLVRHFLRACGDSVLWVNPYPVRLPRLKDLHRSKGLFNQGTPSLKGLEVLEVAALPVEPLPGGSFVNEHFFWAKTMQAIERFRQRNGSKLIAGVGKPSRLAILGLQRLQPDFSFYEAMDNFPFFHSHLCRRSLIKKEAQLSSLVDAIYVSSSFLLNKFKETGCPVTKIPNAYDMSIFSPGDAPSRSGLVLGYLGSIAEWFDWELVIRIATSLPHARIELVGPCIVPPPKALPANILICEPCKQTQVMRHLKNFSAGLIPFKVNALTDGVDPIKYYEYKGYGIPVISTEFGEMALRKHERGVFPVSQLTDFPALMQRVMDFRFDQDEIEEFRKANDWESRFSGLFNEAGPWTA